MSMIHTRIDDTLKKDAESVLASMGLKTSDAIRLFLQQTVNVGGLPFRPIAKVPNKTTIRAMEEPESYSPSFDNLEDLWDELDDKKSPEKPRDPPLKRHR